ncbi:MAG TPA: HAMP domain-containing sensor histidine kinase, partial [Acidimicrobiales bacterium]|nr:HAMP domain-containing sensor histidine kinase [Acidimicrobiales bacterium]
QHQLSEDYKNLALPAGPLSAERRQLESSQHQLSQSIHQLSGAVHQLAQAGTVQAAQRASDSHQLLVTSGIALAIVAVLALGSGWLVAGRMLRPIRTITRTARRISSSSLHERLGLEGPRDELKELGDTLDELFGRLEAAFEAQRHFVANASHELRTPLTAERALLQVALDNPDTSVAAWRSTAEEVLASSDEQARLIDALLTLASSESGLDHLEPVDLAAIAHHVVSEPQRRGARHGLQIDVDLGPAPGQGDPRLLESLVANLIDNAITHNVPDGRIHVLTGLHDGRAWLRVDNTGPVVPADAMDHLFEPFRRLDPRRIHHDDGHGLGLSIVRAIATAHGASITADAMDGGGIAIEVTFPAPGPDPAPPTALQARAVPVLAGPG